MHITEELIQKYAKLIYGFAYEKTHNCHNAQDLSQNIMLQLCRINFEEKIIADMDGYIYQICRNVWANYCRSNIKAWKAECIDELESIADDKLLEDEILESELYMKLRYEIMCLGKLRREILIMFYYEEKASQDIAEKLNLPPSTIRWHLGETRKLLKERIEMEDKIYMPKKLSVMFSGWCNDSTAMYELKNDILTQNICIVCGRHPMSAEEIAHTLCMSAVYIENKLEMLEHMNYMSKDGNGRYSTTFFIQDSDFTAARKRWEYEKLPMVAECIYNAAKKALPEIRKIGFDGCDADENYMLWWLVTFLAHFYEIKTAVKPETQRPLRGDGSRHWIMAAEDYGETAKLFKAEPEFADYIRNSEGYVGKYNDNGTVATKQFDLPVCSGNRETPDKSKLYELSKAHGILAASRPEAVPPDDADKQMLAELIREGWVKKAQNSDAAPFRLNVPYFTKGQYEKFKGIADEDIIPEIEAEVGGNLAVCYAEYIERYIPKCLCREERSHVKNTFYHPNAYAYLLYKGGKLKELSDEDKKVVGTVVMEL